MRNQMGVDSFYSYKQTIRGGGAGAGAGGGWGGGGGTKKSNTQTQVFSRNKRKRGPPSPIWFDIHNVLATNISSNCHWTKRFRMSSIVYASIYIFQQQKSMMRSSHLLPRASYLPLVLLGWF